MSSSLTRRVASAALLVAAGSASAAGVAAAADLPSLPGTGGLPTDKLTSVTEGLPGAGSLPGLGKSHEVPGVDGLTGGLPAVPGVPADLPNFQLTGVSSETVQDLVNADQLGGVATLPGADQLSSVPGVSEATKAGQTGTDSLKSVPGVPSDLPGIPELEGAKFLGTVPGIDTLTTHAPVNVANLKGDQLLNKVQGRSGDDLLGGLTAGLPGGGELPTNSLPGGAGLPGLDKVPAGTTVLHGQTPLVNK
jgi:hypothetical protein